MFKKPQKQVIINSWNHWRPCKTSKCWILDFFLHFLSLQHQLHSGWMACEKVFSLNLCTFLARQKELRHHLIFTVSTENRNLDVLLSAMLFQQQERLIQDTIDNLTSPFVVDIRNPLHGKLKWNVKLVWEHQSVFSSTLFNLKKTKSAVVLACQLSVCKREKLALYTFHQMVN